MDFGMAIVKWETVGSILHKCMRFIYLTIYRSLSKNIERLR